MAGKRGDRISIDEGLMVSVVRYALGRATYVVGWTVNETIRVWDQLSANTQHVIRRDVAEALTDWRDLDRPRLMTIDDEQWQRLLDAIAPRPTNHENRREHHG